MDKVGLESGLNVASRLRRQRESGSTITVARISRRKKFHNSSGEWWKATLKDKDSCDFKRTSMGLWVSYGFFIKGIIC